MNEPSFIRGKDIGPDPFIIVLSALDGYPLTTLRMYIRRKGWDVTDIHCSVNMLRGQNTVIHEPFLKGGQRKLRMYIVWVCSEGLRIEAQLSEAKVADGSGF